jgi:hypothetical protein
MNYWKKFYTNLNIVEHNQKSGFFCKGRGWAVHFEPNPSSHILVGEPPKPAFEIVLNTQSEEYAQYVVNLILAAHCLYTGELLTDEERTVMPKRAETIDEIEAQIFKGGHNGISVHHLPVSCLIAVKASQKYKYQYAIFKYYLSLRTMPLNFQFLDPQQDWISGKAVAAFPKERVFYSSVISLCYSALEELSFDIRATEEKPSKIKGRWNPEIRNDLEKRLISSGINLKERLLWTLRETPTKIELTRKPHVIQKTEWSYYKVRDEYWEIIDAIAYVSWLRSHISSHKLPTLSKSLTIYDVANAQHLARRLILETLGFWRYYKKNPSM